MSQVLVECVPNFSEGRDTEKIERILEAIRAVEGVQVLDVDPGAETNRTVVTLLGAPEPIAEAAFRAIQRAAELIDMSRHQGAHPRHGATDVCPFVPVSGATMEDCIALAERVGQRVGEELGIPVYLYDRAARLPERASLAKVRAGEYEALADKLKQPAWKPDFGPATFLPRTGVVTIGAREFLIAYNINLNSRSKTHADDIAWELRETGRALRRDQQGGYYMSGELVKYRPSKDEWPSAYDDFVAKSFAELAEHYRGLGRDLAAELSLFGRDPERPESLEGVNVMRKGRFEACRGVGWIIPEYGRAQVSLNLTDYKVSSPHAVLDAARELAAARGLEVTGSEIVGVVPHEALRASGEHYLARQGASRGIPDGDVLETAVQSLGLRDVADFDLERSVLGRPSTKGTLTGQSLCEFTDELSRPSPTPGGGSIAALCGALAAALASMVSNLTHGKRGLEDRREQMEGLAIAAQGIKDELLLAVDADTAAFNSVLAGFRMPQATPAEKSARQAAIQAGYKEATSVPLRTAELCLEAIKLCRLAAERGLPASLSDAGVGALAGRAGVLGGVYNVRINLGEIQDAAWVAERRQAVAGLVAEADRIELETRGLVEEALEGG